MSTDWKYNSFVIVATILILRRLPIGNGIKNTAKITTLFQSPEVKSSCTSYASFVGDDHDKVTIDDISIKTSEESLSVFVRPVKVHNFTLNGHDLYYETQKNKRAGTFRNECTQNCDSHPEYILNMFGQQLHLVLHHDKSLIPPKIFRFLQIFNNRTKEMEEQEAQYLGCYYKGYVQSDDQSAVAVSLCNGMTGYIKSSFGSFFIEPVQWSGSDTSDVEFLHKAWHHSRHKSRHIVPRADLSMNLQTMEKNINRTLLRRKLNNEEHHSFTIEVLVAVDGSMSKFHKCNLYSYILDLFSIVSKIFADASNGNFIYISVIDILIMKDDDLPAASNNSDLLGLFCNFAQEHNYHYDTAMFITRDKICNEPNCESVGSSYEGTICTRFSCFILQDHGLGSAYTIAHELGHILNIPHDDDDRCTQFHEPGTKPKLHIMSSTMTIDDDYWTWSNCSHHYISKFLENYISCLKDVPTVYVKDMGTKLPGEMYTLDQQCQLRDGNSSKYCFESTEECKELWCEKDDNPLTCRSDSLAWADGTPCRNNTFWCQKGECVARQEISRHVVHGGWGPWSEFTPCSLTCGGGIQESQRECNNPWPRNGGKYCEGIGNKYRSCNTQNCPPGSLDIREQHCNYMNGLNLGIEGIDHESAKWVPEYNLNSKDKCKLFCRLEGNSTVFKFSNKVTDGIPCSFDSFDKCVNGQCRPAGCDNVLDSMAKSDKCGVCDGKNDTCEDYTGIFYVSDLYKVQSKLKPHQYYVTTIPKGASNILITQSDHIRENYIVLRDDSDNYLLNGNKSDWNHTVIFYAGVTLEYSGRYSAIKRVNSTYSRKLTRDLVIKIFSHSILTGRNNDSVLLTYTYTMAKPNLTESYHWEMEQWSSCNAPCKGSSFRQPVCVSSMKIVAPELCNMTIVPQTEYRSCNTECKLFLEEIGGSECSAACGNWGRREIIYRCIQSNPGIAGWNVVDLAKCLSKSELLLFFEFNRFQKCIEGCWAYTEWTPCSKTCGVGIQTREVACYLNRTRISDTFCNSRKKNLNDFWRLCEIKTCDDDLKNYSTSDGSIISDEV